MALLRIDFYSRYLKRNVMLTAVIPADKMDGEKLAKRRRGPYRTVYLLHGLFGRDVDGGSARRSGNHAIRRRRTVSGQTRN